MDEHRNFDEEYPGGWLDEPDLYTPELVDELKQHLGQDQMTRPTLIYCIEFTKETDPNDCFAKIGHTINYDNRYSQYRAWANKAGYTMVCVGILAFDDHDLALEYERHLLDCRFWHLGDDEIPTEEQIRAPMANGFPNPTEVCEPTGCAPWDLGGWAHDDQLPKGAMIYDDWFRLNRRSIEQTIVDGGRTLLDTLPYNGYQ